MRILCDETRIKWMRVTMRDTEDVDVMSNQDPQRISAEEAEALALDAVRSQENTEIGNVDQDSVTCEYQVIGDSAFYTVSIPFVDGNGLERSFTVAVLADSGAIERIAVSQ